MVWAYCHIEFQRIAMAITNTIQQAAIFVNVLHKERHHVHSLKNADAIVQLVAIQMI